MKNEKDPPVNRTPETPDKPEYGADSQLHNYNIALTRLGDLFGDDEDVEAPKSDKRVK